MTYVSCYYHAFQGAQQVQITNAMFGRLNLRIIFVVINRKKVTLPYVQINFPQYLHTANVLKIFTKENVGYVSLLTRGFAPKTYGLHLHIKMYHIDPFLNSSAVLKCKLYGFNN